MRSVNLNGPPQSFKLAVFGVANVLKGANPTKGEALEYTFDCHGRFLSEFRTSLDENLVHFMTCDVVV